MKVFAFLGALAIATAAHAEGQGLKLTPKRTDGKPVLCASNCPKLTIVLRKEPTAEEAAQHQLMRQHYERRGIRTMSSVSPGGGITYTVMSP